MAPTLPTAAPGAANSTAIANTGFRLGEDDMFEASDSDQSARSERSVSPPGTGEKMSKTKKRKARKQVGALTAELDTLLSSAFQAPASSDTAFGMLLTAGRPLVLHRHVDADDAMQDDATSTKKMSKRTRQNLLKAEARKRMREQRKQNQMQDQAMAPVQRQTPQANSQKQQKQGKKNATQVRRKRKERQRSKQAVGEGDAMEIG